MHSDDTIVAISSAIGVALRAIVRLSGPSAIPISNTLLKSPIPTTEGGVAIDVTVTVRQLEFPATLYIFRAPKSATGEDVVEFHIPGSALLTRWVIDAALAAGARSAEPGEFTARAYFNGRVDLVQAEGIAAAVSANNQAELDAARRLMSGELAKAIRPIVDSLTELLALIEVAIDFVDEEVTFLSREQIVSRIGGAQDALTKLLSRSGRMDRLLREPTIALVGRPNAGKSTLLNCLAGMKRAVVSPIAGTTRDRIEISVPLARGFVRLIDMAGFDLGLPVEPRSPLESIAKQMHDAAMQTVETCDVLVYLRDVGDEFDPIRLNREPDCFVITKCDTGSETPTSANAIRVSAMNGINVDQLKAHLDELAFGASTSSDLRVDSSTQAGTRDLLLNARHTAAIGECLSAVNDSASHVDAGPEVIALHLREAIDQLGTVVGQVSTDEVLGRIFSTFCIGK